MRATVLGVTGALVDDLIGGVVSDSVGRQQSGRLARNNKAVQQNTNGSLMDA